MRMYVWRSEALKNYSDGYIIILAGNINSARAAARAKFPSYIKERWEWLLPDYCGGDPEDYNEKLALFEKDISDIPQLMGSMFIAGSE